MFSRCQDLIIELVCSIITFLSDNSSAAVGPDPSSLRRVWLARLVRCMLFADCICWHGVASMLPVWLADVSILLAVPHQLHMIRPFLSLRRAYMQLARLAERQINGNKGSDHTSIVVTRLFFSDACMVGLRRMCSKSFPFFSALLITAHALAKTKYKLPP